MTRLLLALAILSTVVPRAASGQAITHRHGEEGHRPGRRDGGAPEFTGHARPTPVQRNGRRQRVVRVARDPGRAAGRAEEAGLQDARRPDGRAGRHPARLAFPVERQHLARHQGRGARDPRVRRRARRPDQGRQRDGGDVPGEPGRLVKALQGEGLLDIYRDYEQSAGFRFASRFSLAASFDTSRGETPNSLLANEQQLSAWSVRVVAYDTRDPRGRKYHDFWTTLAHEQGAGQSRTSASASSRPSAAGRDSPPGRPPSRAA